MSTAGRVSSDELAAEPGKYLLCMRVSYGVTKLLDKIGPDRVLLVWSMWSGYWQRDGSAPRAWAERHGTSAQFVHSGGHAWSEDLRRLEDALAARQVVRVHTDVGEQTV